MQTEMIYGDSPDFDTMISQLKLLTDRIRLINENNTSENKIIDPETKN